MQARRFIDGAWVDVPNESVFRAMAKVVQRARGVVQYQFDDEVGPERIFGLKDRLRDLQGVEFFES